MHLRYNCFRPLPFISNIESSITESGRRLRMSEIIQKFIEVVFNANKSQFNEVEQTESTILMCLSRINE